MASDTQTACTCAAMQLFSLPLDSKSLLTNSSFSFSTKALPSAPSDIARQMSGLRDDSLTKAQTSLVAASLTQENLNHLPNDLKTMPVMKQFSDELILLQSELIEQTARVQGLDRQISQMEEMNEFGEEYIKLLSAYKTEKVKLDHISSDSLSQISNMAQMISTSTPNTTSATAISLPEMDGLSMAGTSSHFSFTSPEVGLSDTPSLPNFSAMPAMPNLPAMPAIPEPFSIDGVDWIKIPAGLVPTPELPAMPAFSGLPDGLPAVPSIQLDQSIANDVNPPDAHIISDAQSASGNVKFEDVQAFFPEKVKQALESMKSALTKTADGFQTQALDAIPPLPERPALPAFPATADLTPFTGMKIPTLPSLSAHANLFSPEDTELYKAIWTEIDAKQAAHQRVGDAVKENTAQFQLRMRELVDAQEKATQLRMPLAQYLESSSGKNPLYIALEEQKSSLFATKLGAMPESPEVCKANCTNAQIRSLFPDMSSPAQVATAAFFGDETVATTPGMKVISVGNSEDLFVKAHLSNLEKRVQSAGGKTVAIVPEDLEMASADEIAKSRLETKLQGVSLVTVTNVQDLSPQASALLTEMSKKISASAPVIITTPSIGKMSSNSDINHVMVSQIARNGSVLDVRKQTEIPQSSVSDSEDESEFSQQIKGLFKKFS